MPKELVISAAPHETRVAILEDGQLCEIYIEREKEFALVGSIYKGRVTRVLPGMQSAFVDIGLDSDAFLYVGDFLENLEDYDHVVSPAENKIEKMEQQGGNTFVQPASVEGQPADAETPGADSSLTGGESISGEEAQPDASAFDSGSGQSKSEEEPFGEQRPVSQGYDEQQPRTSESAPAAPRYSAPASGQPSAPVRTPFGRQDRGSGNYGGQGRGNDRGNDRGGGRRRGGRWRRGRDNDRRPGRDLPPSKYASSSSAPRAFTPRPYEPPTEELPADFEPVILPGESLAKYKDRTPGAAHAPAPAAPTPANEPSTASRATESGHAGLPSSLYAAPLDSPPAQERPGFTPVNEQPAIPAAEAHSSFPAAELSDDEATALAEQLAEARHEEASAEAEAQLGIGRRFDEDDPPAPESAAETDEFVAEAQEQEQEEAEREGAHQHEAASESQFAAMDDVAADEASPGNEARIEPRGETESETDQALPDQAQELADQIGNVAPPSSQERQPMSARIGQPNRARFQRPMRRGGRQRGGGGNRPARQHDSRHQQAQRRPQLISEMLKAGQEILVQIAKEPLGKKGARITSHVALPGRFLVYMPTVNHIGVSRRIGSAEERSRLRRLVTESKGTFPGGFIVRTAAEGAPDDEIRADVEFLGRTWEKTLSQAEPRKAPSLLHRDLNLVERILRDYVSNDYTAIWINSQEEYSKVLEFVSRFQPKLVDRVKLYTKSTPIFEEFGIQQELDKALRPKVWLKSGGYIVINHTEALVAIDVNTGKYVGRGSTRLEDTIVKTNLEAVKEIVRQIRLRDLGGIIILDFIDMEERRNRDKVMAALDSALRADRAPSKALSFNEFGLVAVTRKRTKQALERVLCQPCPYCTGSGMVKSVPTICYEIQAEARKMSPDLDGSSLTLRVHPEIAKTLKTREAALIEELEQITRKSVIIQADPTLHWEQYDIY